VTIQVSTAVFEGPFDLLLHLITKEQVNLNEVRLSAIVDSFLHEIEAMQALDLEVATEFLLIASTLVELKLRRLLPERSNVELDEDLALLEERDLLLAKLLEYQTFRHAAQAFRALELHAGRSYPRTNVTEERFANLTPDMLATVTPKQLRDAMVRVLNRANMPKEEPKVNLHHVTQVRTTVAEAVTELARLLPRQQHMTFRSLVAEFDDVVDVIVRFLAVLELYKQGWVEIEQPVSFGDLEISWRGDGPDTARQTPQGSDLIPASGSAEDAASRPVRVEQTGSVGSDLVNVGAAAADGADAVMPQTQRIASASAVPAGDEAEYDVESDEEIDAELDKALSAVMAERLEPSIVEPSIVEPSVFEPSIVVDDYDG
jgi:segregation and condensation protein A